MLDRKKSQKPLVYRNTLAKQVNVVQVNLDAKRAKGQISDEFWRVASLALKLLVDMLTS
jgi:hypothetical protein